MGIDLKIRVKNADYDARLCTYIYICVFSMSIYPPKMFFFEFAKVRLFLAKYLQDVYIKNDIIGYTLDIP